MAKARGTSRGPVDATGSPLTAGQRRAKRKPLSQEVAQVLSGLYEDKARPTVFLGLARPLIAAGLRRVIRDPIVGGHVDVVVSTGAILYQDTYQARGFGHYPGTPGLHVEPGSTGEAEGPTERVGGFDTSRGSPCGAPRRGPDPQGIERSASRTGEVDHGGLGRLRRGF